MARHLRESTNLHEHKFNTKYGETVEYVTHAKLDSAFRWLDPRTWIYLWYAHYEVQIEWKACFKLNLVYMDTIARVHTDGESLAVTLVPTFFRQTPGATEERVLITETCKTVVTIPEAEQVYFTVSIKLLN